MNAPLRTFVLLATLLTSSPGLHAQIVINEVLSSNASINFDEDGSSSDWIELRNNGSTPIDLEGYALSDDTEVPRKWELPSVVVPPGGYLLIWCSGKDRTSGIVPKQPELLGHWPLDAGEGEVFENLANPQFDGYLPPTSNVGWAATGTDNGGFGPRQEFAALFTGANSWIETDFLGVAGNNPRTIACWIKVSERAINDILGYGVPTNGLKWHFRVNTSSGNGLVGAVRTEYQGGRTVGTTVVDDGEWHHVASVFPEGANHGGEIVHYVDGVRQGATTGGNLPIDTRTSPDWPVSIGLSRQSQTSLRWFRGLIADLRFYDSGLEAEGVAAVMEGEEPPEIVVPLNLHTNFRLDAEGETVFLIDSRGEVLDLVELPVQYRDLSYGRSPDGTGEFLYLTEPSPREENTGDATAEPLFVADTKFAPDRGFFDAPFTVEISTVTEGASIRYTLDGSAPSATNGVEYSEPIPVSDTTTIRAIALADGLQPTNVDTHTYIFIETPDGGGVINQPARPEGFPATWGPNGGTADYEMDPQIATDTSSAYYDPRVAEGLLAMPTLSLVLDVDDFFDPETGIHTNPLQRGDEWERACSIEFIYPEDPDNNHQANAGLRIQGNASRQPSRPKHNLRLEFRSIYGEKRLRHDLFEDTSVDEFETLILRGGNGDSWFHPSSTQQLRAQYIRDQWHRDIQQSMGHLTAHQRYMHLYVNGLYWGLYHVFERCTADFLASHLGGDEDDWDAHNSLDPLDGDLQSWNEMMAIAGRGLADAENYAEIQEYLDVPNLIDFMLINFYSGNVDWDTKNWYAGRRRAPGAGYMFFVWDSERTFWNVGENRTTLNIANRPSSLHQRLTQNPEYRLLFADHVHRHFFRGGLLTPATAAAVWLKRAEEIEEALVAESARFGDNKRSVPYRVNVEWLDELEAITGSYMQSRTGTVLSQLRSRGLYPTVTAPGFSPRDENIEPGFVLSISAASEVFYTLDGSDPRLPGGEPSPTAIRLPTGDVDLQLDSTTRVRARAREGTTWSAMTDATFVTPSLSITEIMYHPAADSGGDEFEGRELEFLELRNVSSGDVDLRDIRIAGDIEFDFSTGTIQTLSPGEFVVVVHNLEAFAARYGIEGRNVAGTYAGRLSNGGGLLTVTGGVGETIQELRFDDRWHPLTDGGGYSLVARDEEVAPDDPNLATEWRASLSVGGSPGISDVSAGRRVPGDLNSNGSVELSDAIFLAAKLFQGETAPWPCGSSLRVVSNLQIADWNGDASVDVSDIITALLYLFSGGSPHALGVDCREFDTCPGECE